MISDVSHCLSESCHEQMTIEGWCVIGLPEGRKKFAREELWDHFLTFYLNVVSTK